MTTPYESIALEQRKLHLSSGVTNARLSRYYSGCFQAVVEYFKVWPCWTCTNCLGNGNPGVSWGTRPSRCPSCQSNNVYEVATFQARASHVWNAFTAAFHVVMEQAYRLPLTATPGNTTTHDFEIGQDVSIEAKGSPRSIKNPDGTTSKFDRPGMERSDTEKKAFANGETHRRRKPEAYFCVVTNALPSNLVGFRSDNVNAIFDVTKTDRLDSMMDEIGVLVDLEAFRRRRGM